MHSDVENFILNNGFKHVIKLDVIDPWKAFNFCRENDLWYPKSTEYKAFEGYYRRGSYDEKTAHTAKNAFRRLIRDINDFQREKERIEEENNRREERKRERQEQYNKRNEWQAKIARERQKEFERIESERKEKLKQKEEETKKKREHKRSLELEREKVKNDLIATAEKSKQRQKDFSVQRAHEIEMKEMDLEIERERSKTMEKMLEMAKSMNMDLEDLKKFLDDN